MTNTLLTTLDGKTKRTLAYTCGDETMNDSAYIDQNDFVAARGVKSEMPLLQEVSNFMMYRHMASMERPVSN